jgi:glutathione S-transferase
MAITLYDLAGLEGRRFSPFGWRARLALAHKGLEADAKVVRVGFMEKHKLAFSDQQLVPVIVDHANGDKMVNDSWAIACYLDETYPDGPSLLGGPGGRGMAQTVAVMVNTQIHPQFARLVVLDILKHVEPEAAGYFRKNRESRFGALLEEVQAGREERLPAFQQSLQPFRAVVSEQPFIGGAAPNYADYCVFSVFQWGRVISDFKLLNSDDPMHAWRERMLDLYDGMPRTEPGYPV